ncbi:GcrA cell cycle regulator [Aureimonas flava]|uniref:GcrA cell cycle regulator n=1 Tax=Aureimonas flava TaxID=2320271 RepID=A0A3A1WM54_9HYPH|nr:GcrA family cell cycle regulator [Aureimonas flava]RIY00941.1 GcrA cell cycle regulator [Aureimonas flava]
MSWTDERIDLLKQLWGEGLSASQIAAQLGGVTRNAVIGKVHRLKLDSRLKASTPMEAAVAPRVIRPVLVETAPEEVPAPRIVPVATPAVAAIAPAATVPVRPARPATLGATALKLEIEPEVEEEEVVGRVEVQHGPGEVVPISRNLTLVQLSDRTCKWPLGDPLSDEFRFCGNHAPDASPYCQYHARIAFQPVSERRRVR